MRTEYTRQTRWAHPPEAVVPEQCPPGSPYAREWVWVPCTACDLQVHGSLVRGIREGMACPECGAELITPSGGGSGVADKIEEDERRLTVELRKQEVPCSDSSPRSGS